MKLSFKNHKYLTFPLLTITLIFTSYLEPVMADIRKEIFEKRDKESQRLQSLEKCIQYHENAEFGSPNMTGGLGDRYAFEKIKYEGEDTYKIIAVSRIKGSEWNKEECTYEQVGILNKEYKFDVCKNKFSLIGFDCALHKKYKLKTEYTTFWEYDSRQSPDFQFTYYRKRKGDETELIEVKTKRYFGAY